MAPIESHPTELSVVPVGAVGGFPQQSTGHNVSLAFLLDSLIQRTYHDLIVLSELLPRKMDMEKKIEIVKFASKTRQSFIRLLALVKWASSAAKVDKCAAISDFLDYQGLLLVDTADMLARMARENLVHARLPNFSIPCAVDVLTTGRYRRLPTCIKEQIVPADPITASEKTSVLLRLNQIIQHRLVTSDLPSQLSNLSIIDGTVKFHVPQEFEATLTLMGDDHSIPWRLLHVDILVKDPDTGDGKALVHNMQIHYIHQLVQSRLFTEDKPLADMYNVLHSFCQSLQLEVLNSQAHRLMRERWGEHVTITGYMAAQNLSLAYWRAQSYGSDKSKHRQYSVTICVDKDSSKPLDVKHTPSLTMSEAAKVNQAIKSEMLSIEHLLVESILIRSKIKLKELQTDLKKANISSKGVIQGNPPVLSIAILEPCSQSEYLTISVDMQTGLFQPYVAHAGAALLEEIEECLNSDPTKLYQYIIRLKFTISIEHCKRAVQLQPIICLERLPLVSISAEHPLGKVSPNRLYLKLTKHVNYYVVVEFITEQGGDFETQIKYYLLKVRPSTYYDQTSHDATSQLEPDTGKSFLCPLTLFPLDTQSLVYGPDTEFGGSVGDLAHKNKRHSQDSYHHSPKKRRCYHVQYFEHKLAHITALCDIRIPYIQLLEELNKNHIAHQGVQVEAEGVGLVLRLISAPPFDGPHTEAAEALAKNLISCSFRLQQNNMRWQIQLCFSNCPIRSTTVKEQAPIRHVYLCYEQTSAGSSVVWKQFVHEWNSIVRLYKPVLDFAPIINDYANQLNVEVRSFSYKRLTMAYGKDRYNTVTIRWEPDRKSFNLPLGTGGAAKAANCHVIILEQLRQEFNQHQNIAQLMQVLQDTHNPLQAIARLPTRPGLGAAAHPHYPLQQFCVIPQSSTHIRIAYRSIYCIDVHCRGKNMVAIRDGAHSLFDTSKVVTGFSPTPGLKVFLDMFVDDTVLHAKRRSITEDDNPPSPVPMDTIDLFPQSQQPTSASPLHRGGQHNAGFGHTVASSPAHPASPHTSVLQQQYGLQSPGVACPMASPPNIAPSPSGAKLGTPSPAFAAGSPSNMHHVPSPGFVAVPSPMSVNMHSPAGVSFISSVGMHESSGSPYPNMSISMQSPRNWPASPSVPGLSPSMRHQSPGSASIHSPGTSGTVQQHASQSTAMLGSIQSQPSRSLPQRSWAGSIPTILSHDALYKLCTPAASVGVSSGPGSYQCCPLERFLSAIYLKKQLQRVLHGPAKSEALLIVPSSEPGVIQFKTESFLFQVSFNPAANLSLQLQAKPIQETTEHCWSQEELHVLSKFFEVKVASPPFKTSTLTAFTRLISAPTCIIRDFIQLMRLELVPDHTLKWTLQWCLTISPNIITVAGIGNIAVVVRNKILFFIQLTGISQNLNQGQEPLSIIVPIIHDPTNNSTLQLEQTSIQNNSASSLVSAMLKRWNDYNINSSECSIFPAIRDLMANLAMPVGKI